jgi:hypothetical protein
LVRQKTKDRLLYVKTMFSDLYLDVTGLSMDLKDRF